MRLQRKYNDMFHFIVKPGSPSSEIVFKIGGAPLEPLNHKCMCYKQVVPLELLQCSAYDSVGVACL
ncbi:hypothetical protein MgSA37_00484 [Mucilaginibacter gotjawali]|uniref:Uncharacterized protein n=2 Tax=Mucilaginibacter gotjawali TaxID=1550579 RepID=A0A839SN37_9SPHI|nr:hypothetical protein [Mucilaginibacter gotjawali]BAU52329.1 hypothetical protein MgSA37_00484 [Mucilaginibacter gotjawali]